MPTSSLPSQTTVSSRTAIAVASGIAGLWIRPPRSSVVKSVGVGGRCLGLDVDDVDHLAVDVVATSRGSTGAPGGGDGDQRHSAGGQRGQHRTGDRTGRREQKQKPCGGRD